MSDKTTPSLPVEILVIVAQFHYEKTDSQKEMYNFCLVGRAWYSAGIELLYRSPRLDRGNSFAQFIATVSPPPKARKPKTDLGALVKVLCLNRLVHQSSPSQTARLLKATSSGLVEFVAPRVSFAINGLAGLAKCQNLRHLDLRLVMGNSIDFSKLKKAISNFTRLESLSLPSSMNLSPTDTEWPQSLIELTIGGRIDDTLMLSFRWPENLESLSFSQCIGLGSWELGAVLHNDQIKGRLRRLIIGSDNECPSDTALGPLYQEIFDGAFSEMENLIFLKVPADMLLDGFHFNSDSFHIMPLRALEITRSRRDFTDESPEQLYLRLMGLLHQPLCNVWSLVVCQEVWTALHRNSFHQEIEDVLWLHVPEEDDAFLQSPEFAEFESTYPLGFNLSRDTLDDRY